MVQRQRSSLGVRPAEELFDNTLLEDYSKRLWNWFDPETLS
jgi:hypothetical protein